MSLHALEIVCSWAQETSLIECLETSWPMRRQVVKMQAAATLTGDRLVPSSSTLWASSWDSWWHLCSSPSWLHHRSQRSLAWVLVLVLYGYWYSMYQGSASLRPNIDLWEETNHKRSRLSSPPRLLPWNRPGLRRTCPTIWIFSQGRILKR